jgi:hypothetical protein
MRTIAALGILTLAPALGAADKLTWQDRVELARGLDFEYANVKVLLPRSRKPLEFNADGSWDKNAWAAVAKTAGPAAREGDLVQVTRVTIAADRLVLDINGGFEGGRHWYRNVQIGGGTSSTPTMKPIANGDSNAKSGTYLVLLFHKPLEPMKAAEVKKILAPVLDFEKHSASEIYSETLTPCRAGGHQGKARAGRHDARSSGSGAWAAPSTSRAKPPTAWNWKTGSTAFRPEESPSSLSKATRW